MLSKPAHIPMVFVLGLLSGLLKNGQSLGAKERELLMKADIDPGLLECAAAQVTAEQYAQLMRLVMEHSNDEMLGLLSRPLRPGTLALLAGSALSSQSLGSALRRLARSFSLVQDDVLVEVVAQGERTGFAVSPLVGTDTLSVFLQELLLRVFWRLLAWLAGGRIKAQRFDFQFDKPLHAVSYAKLFPGQVEFNQTKSAFWIQTSDLSEPVRRDTAALRSFLADAEIYIMLPQLGEDTVSTRVRTHLLQTRPRWPDLEDCADALHLAPSTLQRRLASEGTSFRAIKDGLRRDAAVARLTGSRISLARLADELGFADSAAFQRAFKAWTGVTPGAVRKQTLSNGAVSS